MQTGVPNYGHFAKKQGRSPPLWPVARTGFILAVCTPLAIVPVPAAAACEFCGGSPPSGGYGGSRPSGGYGGSHPSGGFGAGLGLGLGIAVGGMILEKAIHDHNANNPSYDRPPQRYKPWHPTGGFTPPPEYSPRRPQRYVPPPVEPVRYSKDMSLRHRLPQIRHESPGQRRPQNRHQSPGHQRRLRRVPTAAFPPRTRIASFRTRSCSNSARAFRPKRSMRSRGGNGCSCNG